MLVGTNSSCILCLDARDPHSTQRISMATVRVYKRAKIQHSYSATAASTTSAALRVTDRAGVQPSETSLRFGRTSDKATTRQPGIFRGWPGHLEQSPTAQSFGTYRHICSLVPTSLTVSQSTSSKHCTSFL